MSSQSNKNTSVFPHGYLQRRDAEAQSGRAGAPRTTVGRDAPIAPQAGSRVPLDRKGWKRVRLGDVCDIVCGYAFKSTDYIDVGEYNIVNIGCVQDGRLDLSQAPRISQLPLSMPKDCELNYGDLLISLTGNIGRVCLVDSNNCLLNQRVGKIISDESSIRLRFLFSTLQSSFVRKQIEALSFGAAQLNISPVKMADICICLPSLQEQDTISDAMSACDTHTSALQSLIAKYEAIKKATVNLLLEPKSDWRIVPLGEICEVCSSRRVHESDWTDSGVPFYRARELVALNEGRSITPLHISENLYKELIASSGAIRPGDLLVTGVGSIGVPYLVKRDDKFYFKDGNIIWFKNRGEILPDYFLHAFRSDHIQKQIIEMACVGTVGSYTITNGKRTLIALPPLDEQKRIVAILDSIDGTINGLKSQLAKAQDIKQGMMSYFFG